MAVGIILAKYFEKIPIRDTSKVIVLMCSSFILITIEDKWGIALQKKRACVAKRLSVKFNKLWVGAEVMLFVLVGATVDIKYALSSGVSAVILIFGVLAFRMVGVCLCLIKTRFSRKERLFCMIAYSEGNGAGSNWWSATCNGLSMWGNCFDSCSGCDTDYRSAGGIFHRSDI